MEHLYVTVRREDHPLLVRSRDTLSGEPHTAVVLGEAPDGLPLVLEVRRRGSVAAAVRAALGHPDSISERVSAALDTLDAEVLSEARTQGVEQVQGASVYRTLTPIGGLFGRTMLSRALGSHSPSVLDEERHAGTPEQLPVTAAVALSPAPVTVMKSVRAQRYLAVPTRSGPVFLVELGPDDDRIAPDSLQPLRFEDLRHMPTARAVSGPREQSRTVPLADEAGYRELVQHAPSLAWVVDACDVGAALVELSRSVQAFHDEGRVHCDLKPDNTAITKTGATAIDPLGVAAGEVAPGVTPGWAAPEQLLAQPVSPATDVYALGLMFARLLDAALYGEERSFVIPTGGDERRRVRLIADPDVFIDPARTSLSPDMQRFWASLIRRAIGFEAGGRPQTARELADEAETLLAEEPLTRELGLVGGPGVLRRDVDVQGSPRPGWVITDER